MYDWTALSKFIPFEDSIHFDNLQMLPNNNYNNQRYQLESKYKHLFIEWNEFTRQLKIEGSLLYFMQGHNFTWNLKEYKKTIEAIEAALGVSLSNAEVTTIEYGIIVPVDDEPIKIILSHYAKDEKLRDGSIKNKGNYQQWDGTNFQIKLYNPRERWKQMSGKIGNPEIRKKVKEENQWLYDDNFVKIEIRYTNPSKILNKGQPIFVCQLFDPKFIAELKKDLIQKYEKLAVYASLEPITKREDAQYIDYLSRKMYEFGVELGRDGFGEILNDIGCTSENLLTASNKTDRRKNNRKYQEKVEKIKIKKHDLTERIREYLEDD